MFALIGLACCLPVLEHEEKAFLSWMRETNQFFTGDEYHMRLGIYLANQRYVQEHNAQASFELSMNRLACMTQAEYNTLLGVRVGELKGEVSISTNVNAPDHFDYRDKKVVNPIKDQGQCGSCWAFSAVTAHESQWALQKKELKSLSEQMVVDCTKTCFGCGGGWPSDAYAYAISKQDGLWNTEAEYPYKAVQSTCKFNKATAICKIVGHIMPCPSKTEEELLNACYEKGVVSICIDAGHSSFQLYKKGVYDEPKCSPANLDHAVGLIGWGVEGGVPYWIVRNSWGTVWGNEGYIWMIRNKNNQCGVATAPQIPQV
jgi:cathepsin L